MDNENDGLRSLPELDFWKSFLLRDHAEIKRLDYVIRYNSIPSLYQESVSQHSFWVILHSVLLHRSLCQSFVFNSPDIERKILLKALVHDIGECVTGDLVRTFKYSSPELKNMIDKAEDDMITKYLPESILDLMSMSHTNDSDQIYIEAIVKAADFVSLFHYMHREYNRGNREIMPFLNRMISDMKLMAKKADDGTWYGKKLSALYASMGELVTHTEEHREV